MRGFVVVVVMLAALAVGGGGCGSDSPATTGDAAAIDTFPCGSVNCRKNAEYCFREQWNGAAKVGPLCRALPAGCAACGCARSDAQTITTMCTSGNFTCTDGAAVVDDQASTPTLVVRCDIA